MFKYITIICIGILLDFSCTTPQEARQLKRITKDWRISPVVLHAYADSPLSGSFLTLRNNQKFEMTSSGLFMLFETGTWSIRGDTVALVYLDKSLKTKNQQNVYIDNKSGTLIFEGDDTPTQMRLRIMSNKL